MQKKIYITFWHEHHDSIYEFNDFFSSLNLRPPPLVVWGGNGSNIVARMRRTFTWGCSPRQLALSSWSSDISRSLVASFVEDWDTGRQQARAVQSTVIKNTQRPKHTRLSIQSFHTSRHELSSYARGLWLFLPVIQTFFGGWEVGAGWVGVLECEGEWSGIIRSALPPPPAICPSIHISFQQTSNYKEMDFNVAFFKSSPS